MTTKDEIELTPGAPSAKLYAYTSDKMRSVIIVERGPRGGHYSTTIPKDELPKLIDWLRNIP